MASVQAATWSPLAITLGCPVALARPQTRASLWPSTLYCVIASNTFSCLTVFRRLLLCPPIIILLISGCLQCLPSLQTLALARATIPLASSLSLFGYRARLPLRSSELLSLFYGASVNALRASGALRKEPSSLSIFFPCVKLPGLASLEAVSDSLFLFFCSFEHARPIVALCPSVSLQHDTVRPFQPMGAREKRTKTRCA